MKNERGSALLTVILIFFVTATIGSAISSFIVMNFRLRAKDNEISRAEYQAESAMDYAYLAIQELVHANVAKARNDADEWVGGNVPMIVEGAIESVEEVPFKIAKDGNNVCFFKDNSKESTLIEETKKDGVNVEYVYSEENIKKAQYEVFKVKYLNLFDYGTIKSAIEGKIENKIAGSNVKDYDPDEFGKSDELEIALTVEQNNEENKIREKVKIYYKTPGSTVIQYRADFIIYTPSQKVVYEAQGMHDLNQLVGITNWVTRDWGI